MRPLDDRAAGGRRHEEGGADGARNGDADVRREAADQQEVLTYAADIVIDVVRGRERRAAGGARVAGSASCRRPASTPPTPPAASRWRRGTRSRAMAEGDMLRTLLAALRRVLKAPPVNTVRAAPRRSPTQCPPARAILSEGCEPSHRESPGYACRGRRARRLGFMHDAGTAVSRRDRCVACREGPLHARVAGISGGRQRACLVPAAPLLPGERGIPRPGRTRRHLERPDHRDVHLHRPAADRCGGSERCGSRSRASR